MMLKLRTMLGFDLAQAANGDRSRADVIVRPQVLAIGGADFSQRAKAILEGERAALAAMPQIRERIAQLQAARDQATRLAKQKAAQEQRQACLDHALAAAKAGWGGGSGWRLPGGQPGLTAKRAALSKALSAFKGQATGGLAARELGAGAAPFREGSPTAVLGRRCAGRYAGG